MPPQVTSININPSKKKKTKQAASQIQKYTGIIIQEENDGVATDDGSTGLSMLRARWQSSRGKKKKKRRKKGGDEMNGKERRNEMKRKRKGEKVW
jgi:hypothetical protein